MNLQDPKDVGKRIRSIRKNITGLSMAKFAKLIDSSDNGPTQSGTVSNWENGKNLPNNERLKIIADLGGISVNNLLYGDPKTYIRNILWNSKGFDFDSDTFDLFFDSLTKQYENEDDLYLSEDYLISLYKDFHEINQSENKLNDDLIPLGAYIYEIIKRSNDTSIQIFASEVEIHFNNLAFLSLEEAHNQYFNNKD